MRILRFFVILLVGFLFSSVVYLASYQPVIGFNVFQELKEFNKNINNYKENLIKSIFDVPETNSNTGSLNGIKPLQNNIQQSSYSMRLENNKVTIDLKNSNSEALKIIENNLKQYCSKEGIDIDVEDTDGGKNFFMEGDNLFAKFNDITSIVGMKMSFNMNNEIGDTDIWGKEDFFQDLSDSDPFDEFQKYKQRMEEIKNKFEEEFIRGLKINDYQQDIERKEADVSKTSNGILDKNVRLEGDRIIIDLRTQEQQILDDTQKSLKDYCSGNSCILTGINTNFGIRFEIEGKEIEKNINDINELLPGEDNIEIKVEKEDEIRYESPDIDDQKMKGIRI